MNMNKPERPLDVYSADVSEHTEVRRGVPLPLWTSESGGGVNFAMFSRHASRVRLELFDQHADATPARVVDFDSARNRTGWPLMLLAKSKKICLLRARNRFGKIRKHTNSAHRASAIFLARNMSLKKVK